MNVSDMVRAMREAGCSPEQILAAVEKWDEGRSAHKREADRERQRRHRSRLSRVVTHVTRDRRDNQQNQSDAGDLLARAHARVEDSSTTTVLSGKKNNTPSAKTARDILLECPLKPETADAVLAHRKAKRCPLTPFAARLLVKGFNSTADPEDAAQTMIARGWQGFKSEWYDRDKQNGSGKRSISDIAPGFIRRLDEQFAHLDDGPKDSGKAGGPAVQLLPPQRGQRP